MKNRNISTLQRKIINIKEKLKDKIRSKKDNEQSRKQDTPDFVWIGGFHQRLPPSSFETPRPLNKRKLSFSDDDESEEESVDEMLSPATIELQMAWYKNFHIRFFEDEVKLQSPMKKPKTQFSVQPTSTQKRSPSINEFSAQIRTFREFFEGPAHDPDFKIYDDYNYPSTPLLPPRTSDYRNLVPGNTPAPPLPPRNAPIPRPPTVYRTYREAEMRTRKPLKIDANRNEIFLRRSFSSNCINDYSYLI